MFLPCVKFWKHRDARGHAHMNMGKGRKEGLGGASGYEHSIQEGMWETEVLLIYMEAFLIKQANSKSPRVFTNMLCLLKHMVNHLIIRMQLNITHSILPMSHVLLFLIVKVDQHSIGLRLDSMRLSTPIPDHWSSSCRHSSHPSLPLISSHSSLRALKLRFLSA